jgi:hypothetical protein
MEVAKISQLGFPTDESPNFTGSLYSYSAENRHCLIPYLVERNSGDFLDNSGEESETVGGVEILAARH